MNKNHQFRRAVVVITLLLLFAGPVIAEEVEPPYETFPEALGGFAGQISGTGLHYHKWIGQNAFQVSGGILYVPLDLTEEPLFDSTLDYSIGGEFQRRVYGEAFTNWLAGSLYLFAGGRHRGYIPINLVAGGYPDPATELWVEPVFAVGTFQAEVAIGAGIGMELILFRHFSIPIEFGYGATWTMTETDFADAFLVSPYGQSGLRYRY
ncbi:MAG: hypothetical protein KOO61_08180 [Spirochaetales bacterium]|nr:hypothetical protein [Spirochaetales bacterium]